MRTALPEEQSQIHYRVHFRRSYAPRDGRHHIDAPPPSIIFCATLRRAQNHPRGSYIWVKLVCGSNEPVHFRIRHREPCENQLQRRKMLAKSGSGNNAQTAGNQEFWRNIQGRLRVSYRSFLDRVCVPDGGIWSREDPC